MISSISRIRRLAFQRWNSNNGSLSELKYVDGPEAVLAVPEEGQPRRTTAVRIWSIMLDEHTSHRVLIYWDVERQSYLIGDPLVAEARIPAFRFNYGSNEFWRRSFRSRLSRSPLWRKQFAVLAAHKRSVEVQYCGRLQRNCGSEQASRAQKTCTQSRNESVNRTQVRCSLPWSLEDQ